MIKIEHTLFALPFALLGAFMAARGAPTAAQAAWITLAMVGARSAAMAFNRLVDVDFDRRNPRTSGRALPRGLVSKGFVIAFIVASAGVLVASAAMLNPLAFRLSPVALVIVFFYSWTKRFTWWSHFFLGLSLACAPVGAWVAIRGEVTTTPLMLGLAVALWVAGLDILYACQDVEFDRRAALYSIPQRFGVKGALWTSALAHAAMVGILAWLFRSEGLGRVSLGGVGAVALLLVYEHSLVTPTDLSRVNTAFFAVNGLISILLFATTSVDILMFHSLKTVSP
ncbi:MAG: 4-hydroxybenzoate octaprenyltransferase [Acidobacteria bacterium]|nr:MAG: 4-hydroxybenzoate octaprenyltransferase [Acidobacteriota bacterium]